MGKMVFIMADGNKGGGRRRRDTGNEWLWERLVKRMRDKYLALTGAGGVE